MKYKPTGLPDDITLIRHYLHEETDKLEGQVQKLINPADYPVTFEMHEPEVFEM